MDCGYSLEPPRRGGSNEYPQSMFLSKIRKIMYTPTNPGSALFVILYVNLYQQSGLSILIGWQLEVGSASKFIQHASLNRCPAEPGYTLPLQTV